MIIILIYSVYIFIGCAVLAAVDDKEKRLYKWAKKYNNFFLLTITFWPLVVYFWYVGIPEKWREK